MRVRVFDTETDGLLDTITKIHILSYTEDGENFSTTTDSDTLIPVQPPKEPKTPERTEDDF